MKIHLNFVHITINVKYFFTLKNHVVTEYQAIKFCLFEKFISINN